MRSSHRGGTEDDDDVDASAPPPQQASSRRAQPGAFSTGNGHTKEIVGSSKKLASQLGHASAVHDPSELADAAMRSSSTTRTATDKRLSNEPPTSRTPKTSDVQMDASKKLASQLGHASAVHDPSELDDAALRSSSCRRSTTNVRVSHQPLTSTGGQQEDTDPPIHDNAVDNLYIAEPVEEVDEEELDAQVQQLVQQETEGIAQNIQERLMAQIGHAEQVDNKPVKSPYNKRMWMVLGILVILIIVGVVVGVVLSSGGDGDSGTSSRDEMKTPTENPPSKNDSIPTSPPSLINDLLLIDRLSQVLSASSLSEDGNSLDRKYSSTLAWMGNDDPYVLRFGSSLSDTEIVERFVLIFFYFQTGGERSWLDGFGFLSETPHCEWNRMYDDGQRGIICHDESGLVKEVNMRKLSWIVHLM
jgi:hypothetical protein